MGVGLLSLHVNTGPGNARQTSPPEEMPSVPWRADRDPYGNGHELGWGGFVSVSRTFVAWPGGYRPVIPAMVEAETRELKVQG